MLEKLLVKRRMVLGAGLIALCLLTACGEQKAQQPESAAKVELAGQSTLPMDGEAFAIMAEDVNGDGRVDITAVEHGKNQAQIYLQNAPRVFDAPRFYKGVGFHPGNLFRWPPSRDQFIFGAEGDNDLRSLIPDFSDQGTGFKVQSALRELAPRHVMPFNWPGWGDSVAVSPFANGYIVLLKQYDPVKGQAAERVVVRMSKYANSIRASDRITAGDLNGDGVDELLFVVSMTNELFQVSYPGKNSREAPAVKLLYHDESWGAPNEVHALDLDSDGDNDLLLADETVPGHINLLLNDGKGNFHPGKPLEFPYPNGVTELRVGRDHDGLNYILASGYGAVALYQVPAVWKDGDVMPRVHIQWPADISRDMVFRDIDGDGWLDGIVGRGEDKQKLWVVYGPLWQQFEFLAQKSFVLQ